MQHVLEQIVKQCHELETKLARLEDEVGPEAGTVIVQVVDGIEEIRKLAEG